MIRFLKALILFPIFIAFILLAVANRGLVTLSLDPFSREVPEIAFQVPLYAVVIASVALGIVIGGIGSWLAQGGHRRAERRLKREAARLRSETERLRARANQGARSSLPALPPAGGARI